MTDGLWQRLPPAVRDRIDAELLEYGLVVRGTRVLVHEGGLQPRPGLHEAMDAVATRLTHLREQGSVRPPASD